MKSLSLALRSRVRELAKKFGAENVRVFGSRARGRAREGSDLDMLLRFGKDATLLTVIGFQQALEEALALKVDVVEEAGLSPFIAPHNLREAVAL